MRALVQTVMAVTVLAIAVTLPAEAQKGLGKGRETMRAFPHPYAWAAFGLTGIPR